MPRIARQHDAHAPGAHNDEVRQAKPSECVDVFRSIRRYRLPLTSVMAGGGSAPMPVRYSLAMPTIRLNKLSFQPRIPEALTA